MIIDGICILPTSPKIVYRDLRDRCDWLLHLAFNNYTLSMHAQVKFKERTADKVADSHTPLTSRELS